MLSILKTAKGSAIRIKESCGLKHELQAVMLPVPEGLRGGLFALRDEVSGETYPAQISQAHRGNLFTLLSLDPFRELQLQPVETPVFPRDAVTLVESNGTLVLSNGIVAFELECDAEKILKPVYPAGPVRRFKRSGYPWRGSSYFDVPFKAIRFLHEIVENGPVRVVVRWRMEFEEGRFYEVTITLDAGQSFARFEESFAGGTGGQVVWDFAGDSLPVRVRLLDPTEGCRPVIPNYYMDNRVARLFAWTQGSQLFDLADGFGLLFKEGDEAGFVTLEGGSWRGGQLNHMELWCRRLRDGDMASRRGVPPEAKADANPSPERIAARGETSHAPHLDVEGWLVGGRRVFALTLADRSMWGYVTDEAMKAASDPFNRKLFGGSSHFMSRMSELADSPGQYYLRKLHIQRGVMPLQSMLSMAFEWSQEPMRKPAFGWPHPTVAGQFGAIVAADERAGAESMLDYLKARVHAFWDVSGTGATNPVSGRRIAPELFRFEYLQGQNVLTPQENTYCRALFAFLAYLYASDHFYPSRPPMLPVSDPDAFDPTLAGMSNQNFFTDCINGAGVAAQVFTLHPMSTQWREHFGVMFKRQLECHVYPQSGIWEESHTYYLHVLMTILPTLERRRADGVDDFSGDPLFRKMVGSVFKMVTPRDRFFEGRRHLAPLGDHDPERKAPWIHRELFAQLASFFKDSDASLSRNLAWLCHECGGQPPAGIPIDAPAWTSESVQGLGYLFKGSSMNGEEELLVVRCGAAWGHHHNDDGALQFYADGRAWITDASCGNPAKRGDDKFQAFGHSRWEPHGVRALNYLWRFNRGWIESCGHSPDSVEWTVAYSPVAMSTREGGRYDTLRSLVEHRRTIVKLESALYLVVDSLDLPERNVVRFHVPVFGAEWLVAGNRVTFCAEGKALDIAAIPHDEGAITFWDSVPSSPDAAKFATKCVEFDCGTGCLCVSAFHVRSAERAPMCLSRTPKGAVVEAGGRSWQVEFMADRKFEIRTPEGDAGHIG